MRVVKVYKYIVILVGKVYKYIANLVGKVYYHAVIWLYKCNIHWIVDMKYVETTGMERL